MGFLEMVRLMGAGAVVLPIVDRTEAILYIHSLFLVALMDHSPEMKTSMSMIINGQFY